MFTLNKKERNERTPIDAQLTYNGMWKGQLTRDLYKAAIDGKSVKFANQLTDEALALSGYPAYQITYRRWSKEANDYLDLFRNQAQQEDYKSLLSLMPFFDQEECLKITWNEGDKVFCGKLLHHRVTASGFFGMDFAVAIVHFHGKTVYKLTSKRSLMVGETYYPRYVVKGGTWVYFMTPEQYQSYGFYSVN